MSEGEPHDENPYLLQNVIVKVEVVEDGVVNGLEINNLKPVERKKAKRIHKKSSVQLSCDKCDYKTIHKSCLQYHKMKHDNTNFSCNLCSYKTKYPLSLKRHTISFHGDLATLPRYKCEQCPYESIFKSNLAGHMRKHSTEKKYRCDKCDYASAYSLLLDKHNKTHHTNNEQSYHCHKCPFVARTDAYLVRHLSQVHEEVSEQVVKCENCNFCTKTPWRLNNHKKKSYVNTPLHCRPCNFVTNYKCEFRGHKKKHDIKDIPIGSTESIRQQTNAHSNCDMDILPKINEELSTNLGSNIISDLNIAYHKNLKMEQTGFYNQYEEIQPNSVANYLNWRDIPVNEIPGLEKPFLCTVCSHSSKFKAAVQRHYQRHHMSNTKPYKCVNCDFTTKTKDQIGLHNKRSKSDTIQCCPNCTFMTYFKCHLVMHQKTHNPYKCKLCDYSCRQKYYMQKHYTSKHDFR